MAAPTVMTDPVHQMRCMEIWGGNDHFDNAIATAGIDAWIYSRPYRSGAGGDIHYVSTCGHGHIARFAVADVSGHGDEVSAIGARLRRLMRRHINKLDQTRFLRALNTDFNAQALSGIFATALLTSYYAPTDQLVVCNAGHPPPFWYRATQGTWQVLDPETPARVDKCFNLPLGIIEPTEFQQFAVQLGKDDLVVLYSDWLMEAKSPDGGMLGEEGIRELLATIDLEDPATMVHEIIDRVDDYRGHAEPDDDRTLIVLHHNAADPPRVPPLEMMKVMGKVFGLIKV